MGLFQTASPFDADVEKATSEKNTSVEWGKMLDICDKVGTSTQNAKDCLRSIVKRLYSPDPHRVMQALTLLDVCVINCGKTFHLEIASRDFEGDLRKLVNHQEPKIAEKVRELLKKWAENDFKTDPQLNLIPSLYNQLKNKGYDFTSTSETAKRNANVLSKDPNVVTNSQEEEDIAKAIELSLKDSKAQNQASASHDSPRFHKQQTNSGSLYPSVKSAFATQNSQDSRTVRALYDFEAAEDNELTFLAGELINILDDSDPNWWKGSNKNGEGLFPSNFVTADLSVEPEEFTKLEDNNKKMVQFADEVEVKTVKREPEIIEVEIDERKMDRLLHLLHEADPQCDNSDPQEMLDLEEQVTAMGPLIDAALEKVDRRHAQLTQLSSDLVDALNLYHTLMREPPSNYALPKMPAHLNPYQFQNQVPPPAAHIYNGVPPAPQPPSFPLAGGQSGPYNAPLPANEFLGPTSLPNINLPQHFHVQPAAHAHAHAHAQTSGVQEQSNLAYAHQGFQPQSGSIQGPYATQAATRGQIAQQQQFAPPNSQHMM